MPVTVKLSPYAIVDEGEAKAWAHINQQNIPGGDLLRLLINAATFSIEDWLKLEIISRGLITEDLDVKRIDIGAIWTLHRPILDVNELNSDTVRSFGTTTVIDPSEYIVYKDRGKIVYIAQGGSLPTYFAAGLQSVRVKYWAGYKTVADIPEIIKSSAMETVALYYYHITRKNFDVSSISDESGSRTFVRKFSFLPDEVKANLSSKRRRSFARQRNHRVSLDTNQQAP
jgi:hypothetical protein